MAEGWAVIVHGNIDVRTAGPTRRSAIVNWLVVGANTMVMSDWTDDDIERHWKWQQAKGVTVEPVQITRI